MSVWYMTGGRMTEWADIDFGGFMEPDPPINEESIDAGPDVEEAPIEDDPAIQEEGVTEPKEI